MADLTRRMPREMEDFGQVFDRFFSEPSVRSWLSNRSEGLASWTPAIDIREQGNAYVFAADLPGLGKEDVDVTFEDNVLTIAGERRFEEKEDEGEYRRVERRYGKFTRSFALPSQVDSEKVEASFKNGVLTITVPKLAAAQARKVKIL